MIDRTFSLAYYDIILEVRMSFWDSVKKAAEDAKDAAEKTIKRANQAPAGDTNGPSPQDVKDAADALAEAARKLKDIHDR